MTNATDSVISREDFDASVRQAERERHAYIASLTLGEYRARCEWAIYIDDDPRFAFITEQDAREYLVLWREDGVVPVPASVAIKPCKWSELP
jgi:hypothetical protein